MQFYFDIERDGAVAKDDRGADCPNVDAARVRASVMLTEMAREYLPSDGPSAELSIIVRDEAGEVLRVELDYTILEARSQSS
jgi:hypothetical protein